MITIKIVRISSENNLIFCRWYKTPFLSHLSLHLVTYSLTLQDPHHALIWPKNFRRVEYNRGNEHHKLINFVSKEGEQSQKTAKKQILVLIVDARWHSAA